MTIALPRLTYVLLAEVLDIEIWTSRATFQVKDANQFEDLTKALQILSWEQIFYSGCPTLS